MKKILIIGWSKNEFVNTLYTKLNDQYANKFSFDLFSITELGEWITDPYVNKIEATLKGLNRKWINKIPKARKVVYIKNLKREFKKIYQNYDIIHFHYMFEIYNELNCYLNDYKGKIVATVWGSDFYRKSKKSSIRMLEFYKNVSLFTFANPAMREDFLNYYKTIDVNYAEIRFGLSILGYNQITNNNFIKSAYFNFPNNKIKVFVGTNASKYQQHLKILEEIKKFPKNIKNKLFLVFPLTYGLINEYEADIKNILSDIGIPYMIIKEFLADDNLIELRESCDILLQLQTTDALSGAMQEHLYFGSIVITGNWLPYKIFDDNGLYYHKINQIDQLLPKFKEVVISLKDEKERIKINKSIIKEISSWDANIDKWAKCYSIA